MIARYLADRVNRMLRQNPAVVLLGPRQVGKTTLALHQIGAVGKERLYLDLERPSDAIRLEDAEFFLSGQNDKLVVIDEVQRRPDLFPILRSLIDAHRVPGRFVLLGSASEELIAISSETLAGRVSYLELHPLSIAEIPAADWSGLWIRGGFPPAFLAADDEQAFEWISDFVRTYIERELGISSLRTSPVALSMFLRIVSSVHGQMINYSELARVLQISTPTVKNYLQFFEHAFILRTLYPYHANISKRLVKSPKIYVRDSGVLHYLRGIASRSDLEGDLLKGASWEGFAMQQILAMLRPSVLPYFYRTASGAEMDLVLVKGNRPYVAFEFKYGNSPRRTKGSAEAEKDLQCERVFIVTPSAPKYQVGPRVWVLGLADIPATLQELELAV